MSGRGEFCGLGFVYSDEGALMLLDVSWMLDTRSIERVDSVRASTAALLYVRWEETGGGLGHAL